MSGGDGDDSYLVDSIGDTVTEQANDGEDQVFSSATFTLGANVEHLILTGSDKIDGTGNAEANGIFGNVGDNKLTGAGGSDGLFGGGGNDTLLGGDGEDLLTGGDGNDVMTGGANVDVFDFNTPDGSLDTVTDFTAGAGGDVIDISDLLFEFDIGNDDLVDFLKFEQEGSDTVVLVNADGLGNDFVGIALLQNVNAANISVPDNVEFS